MDDEEIGSAYRPPEDDDAEDDGDEDDDGQVDHPPPQPSPNVDGPKLAGLLMLTKGGSDVAAAIADVVWVSGPSAVGVLHLVAWLGVGASLRRWGGRLRLLCLAFLALDALELLLSVWSMPNPLGVPRGLFAFALPLFIRLVRVSPIALLLMGRTSRRRANIAVVGFILTQGLAVAASVWQTYKLATILGR